MKKNPNRFRLPLQRLPLLADWRIQRRLAKAAKARRAEEEGLSGWGSFFSPQYAAVPVAFMLMIAVGGYQWLPGYVYSADSIARGDLFYDWKRSQEQTRLTALTTSAERAEFFLALSDRRLKEAQTLTSRQQGGLFPTASAATPAPKAKPVVKIQVSPKDSLVAGLITESGLFLEKSIQETGRVKDVAVADGLLTKINTQLQTQQQALTEINQTSNEPAVQATVPVVEQYFTAHKSLVEKADQLLDEPAFQVEFVNQGFAFNPIELEILEDEISEANRSIITLYAEIEALENEYEVLEDALDNAQTEAEEEILEDALDQLDDQIDELDEVAEEAEEELEEVVDDLEDAYEDFDDEYEAEDDEFDPEGWAQGWFDEYWEEDWDDDDEGELEDDFEDEFDEGVFSENLAEEEEEFFADDKDFIEPELELELEETFEPAEETEELEFEENFADDFEDEDEFFEPEFEDDFDTEDSWDEFEEDPFYEEESGRNEVDDWEDEPWEEEEFEEDEF